MSPGTPTLHPCTPPAPATYKELEDDAAIGVDVLEGDSARLLEVDGVHEGGRALVRVGSHVVTQRHPRRPGAGGTDCGLRHRSEPRGSRDGDGGDGCDGPQAGGAGRRRWDMEAWGQHGERRGPRMESRALGTARGTCHWAVARPLSLGDLSLPARPRHTGERWVGCGEEEGGTPLRRSRAGDGG